MSINEVTEGTPALSNQLARAIRSAIVERPHPFLSSWRSPDRRQQIRQDPA
jgi:hypothetical protein